MTNGDQTFIAVGGAAVFWSAYALVRARRSGKASEAATARQLATPVTTIADAAPGTVSIRGRATPHGGEPVVAPFSGQPALWVKSSFQTNAGDAVDAWVDQVREIDVDDGSGTIARVPLAGARVRTLEVSVEVNTPRVRAVENERRPRGAVWPYEALLAPGDEIEVAGEVIEQDGEYRSEPCLRFSDAPGAVQITRVGAEEQIAASSKRSAGCATIALVGSTILLAIALIRAFA